jgi:hypothetical protein
MWFEGAPPSGSGKSFNPNGRPTEEIPCGVRTLGPNHASREAERAAFALSKKISMTTRNAKKQEPYERRFFSLFAGVLLARFFFSLRNQISKFDNKGSIRLFQSVFSASVSSRISKFIGIDNAAKILGRKQKNSLARQ